MDLLFQMRANSKTQSGMDELRGDRQRFTRDVSARSSGIPEVAGELLGSVGIMKCRE
jgi:hypothetical protein